MRRLLKNTRLLTATMVFSGCILFSHGAWIHIKAGLAQWLIKDAWQESLKTEDHFQPWPWADTWPVAKLHVVSDENEFYVLAGSHGTSLAFGPGHIDGSALPGENGTIAISGHRDTHFRFLKTQKVNDTLRLQDSRGQWQNYTITERLIHNSDNGPWYVNPDANELHLITCYPFDAVVPGGPLRHITIAEKDVQASIPENEKKLSYLASPKTMSF